MLLLASSVCGLFKWRQFEPEVILMAVGWYLRFSLSYRDVEELLAERGLSVDHVTVWRWVQRYAPELDRRLRKRLKTTNDSWREEGDPNPSRTHQGTLCRRLNMPAPMIIKRREREAVLQALQAGLVPRQGLHMIQVGRKAEVSALIADLDRIAEGGTAFRIVTGRFGSGKTFFLGLIRNLASQSLVVAQADFNGTPALFDGRAQPRAVQ